MSQSSAELWARYKKFLYCDASSDFLLDISRVNFPADILQRSKPMFDKALAEMKELEQGAIANKDEDRMVGHYWLRSADIAPAELRASITDTVAAIQQFASEVHSGKIRSASGAPFSKFLLVGIGGSALGPQFVTQALGGAGDKLKMYCFDNTDPDGMAKVLALMGDLSTALCVVVSKSGGTKETRNGQLIAKEAWKRAGIAFEKSFIAVTMPGSELSKTADSEQWLKTFPMLDWVGGRTSELSAVGLLPAALQGYEISSMLAGAKYMDSLTRAVDLSKNPAGLLALMWHHIGSGKGLKDMVVLPYKDRLELFSRYLQQLVMESLGKELDRDGKKVNQGIAVYGNKGSTDQHAYVQQLRDGINNFFAVFIEVLKDDIAGPKHWVSSFEVESKGITSADYLQGFFLGTRRALFESARESVTITVRDVSPFSVGMLIALFERAVGYYASFINVNAYHQPGVEAGKKAAARVLELQKAAVAVLAEASTPLSVEEIAHAAGAADDVETIYKVLTRLAINGKLTVAKSDPAAGLVPDGVKFSKIK